MTSKKWIWPVLGLLAMTALTAYQDAMTDQRITSQEWVQVIIQAVMAVNVWATANLPQYTKMKTLVAAALVVLQALYTFIVGGVDTPEVINLIISALAAVGVAATRQPLTTTQNGQTIPPP